MMVFAKMVAKAIEKTIECKRIGIAVVGLEVPHTHIHLIPITKENDMNFANPHIKLSNEEFEKIAQQIAANIK